MAFIYPVNAPVSQPFGVNPASYQPNGHYGIDFACATGTDIRSIGDGVVRWADWNDNLGANPWNIIPYAKVGSGIFVAIDHGNGYVSLYCHLSETLMNIGDRVVAGSIIGKSGSTGNSTGPHLHLEVIYMPNVNGWNYGRVDPASLMSTFVPVGSVKIEGNQRKVGPSNLNQRSEAKTTSNIVRVVPSDTIETFTGFVIGEMVDSGGVRSNIWYADNVGYVWSGGFTAQTTDGLVDLTPAPVLSGNQRKVGPSNLNQRSEAKALAPVVRTIPAGTIETFTGYVLGEMIDSGGVRSNIWYADSKGYVWSGGFTEQTTNGLANATPSLAANQRMVGGSGASQRDKPAPSGNVVRSISPNTVETFTGYVVGEEVNTGGVKSNIWYMDSKGYVWAGMFTSQSTNGLPKKDAPVSTVKPPAASPIPPATVEEPPYEFVPDFDFVEYKPANTWNMQNGNFPAKPAKIVIHQFDAKAKRPSLDGAIAHLQTPHPDKPASAHFAVSGKRIVQLVSLKDRAQHAGPIGNDYIGIEVDPQEDAETIASVKKLIKALNKKYGVKFTYVEHRDVPQNATECGVDIHLENYSVDEVDLVKPPVTPPRVVPAPETPAPPASPEITIEMEAKIIAKFLSYTSTDLLKKYLDAHK